MGSYQVDSWNIPWASCKRWHIYALFLEPNPGEFLVKIGCSTDPLTRIEAYRQGLPFKPTILWACANGRRSAFKMEHRLHKLFEGRNTFGEWFKFTMDDKQIFHDATKTEFLAATGKELEWNVTNGDQWLEFLAMKREDEKKPGSKKNLPFGA